MCSRRAVRGLLLGAALLAFGLAPTPGAAQDAEDGKAQALGEAPVGEVEALERRLVRELEALREPLQRARERHDAESAFFDSIARARRDRATDSVSVGPFLVIAQPGRLDEAAAAVEEVWRETRALLGDAPDPTGATIVYDPSSDLGGLHFREPSYRVTGRDWTTFRFDPGILRRSTRSAVARDIARHYPRFLRLWVGGAGPLSATAEARTGMYREMALAPSPATDACVEGSVDACLSALGLEPHEAPLTTWYDPGHLHDVAALPRGSGNRRAKLAAGEWTRCVADREGSACVDVQNDPDVWVHLLPFGPRLRSELVALAVEQGGEGSVGRLLEPVMRWTGSGDVESVRRAGSGSEPTYADFASALREGLESASGMEAEALVALWRQRLVDARPEPDAGGETHRMAAFFWVLFFAALSTRSTRWRSG